MSNGKKRRRFDPRKWDLVERYTLTVGGQASDFRDYERCMASATAALDRAEGVAVVTTVHFSDGDSLNIHSMRVDETILLKVDKATAYGQRINQRQVWLRAGGDPKDMRVVG